MVSDRFGDKENQRAIELGRQNAELIKSAKAWCEHIRLPMVSSGLLAQMTGLPIGSIRVSCEHSSAVHESMNLPWILPDFIAESCENCPHQRPTGDTEWGDQIIQAAKSKQEERQRKADLREEKIAALRSKIKQLPEKTASPHKPTIQSILSLCEQLLVPETANAGKQQLLEAIKLAPQLFTKEATELLEALLFDQDVPSEALEVYVGLISAREDLEYKRQPLAKDILKHNESPELASQLFEHTAVESEDIERLITAQHTSYYSCQETYPITTSLLTRQFEPHHSTIMSTFKAGLKSNSKQQRVNTCAVIDRFSDRHSNVVVDLVDDLLATLEIEEDAYGDSADSRACQLLAKAFRCNPQQVDEQLYRVILRKNQAVQELLARIYYNVLSDTQGEVHPDSSLVNIVISRCLTLVRNPNLDLEVRTRVAESLERATIAPDQASQLFDNILGYFIVLSDQPAPPPPLRLITPNQTEPSQQELALIEGNLKLNWNRFKHTLIKSLEHLIEQHSQYVSQTLVDCLPQVCPNAPDSLKRGLITLTGALAAQPNFHAVTLPYFKRWLMNYECNLIRAEAINAITDAFRYHSQSLPEDIRTIVALHLRDPYRIVQKAAIQAFSRYTVTFEDNSVTEIAETLSILHALATAHQNEPHELEDICRGALSISRKHEGAKTLAINLTADLIPTNQRIYDESLADLLTSYVKSDDPHAGTVAKKLLVCLAKYGRDRYNSYDYQRRHEFFNWLFALSPTTYAELRENIKESALNLALKDAWEACHFARLFAKFGDHVAEQEVLTTACTSIATEASEAALHQLLELIAEAARLNQHKISNNAPQVSRSANQILDDHK